MSATTDFFENADLERAILVGYYGGGNYGDELLLEIIQNMLKSKNYKQIKVAFQNPEQFGAYHHTFGHKVVAMNKPLEFVRGLAGSRSIVVGGGGLWGMDVNANIVGLSLLLFLCRYVLFRKVYLVGVGYYGSTSTAGRLGAWLAGKAANLIIARDAESTRQFIALSRHVVQDKDLAWLAKDLDLTAYEAEAQAIDQRLGTSGKSLLITLRHFRGTLADQYHQQIGDFLAANTDKSIIIALLQPAESYPEGNRLVQSWQSLYPNVRVLTGALNPLAFFVFLQKNHDTIALVAPQFHAILTASVNDVPFLPVAYDNKVFELFDQLQIDQGIHVQDLKLHHLQQFADAFYEGRGA